jgi:hypothetical protein
MRRRNGTCFCEYMAQRFEVDETFGNYIDFSVDAIYHSGK